jgi:hypothetical protein
MYCSNCGTQLPDDAVYCIKCGKAQKPTDLSQISKVDNSSNTCFRCGNQAAHKCSSCGQVFCLRHIAYFSVGVVWDAGWTCENCFIAKSNKYSKRVKSSILLVLLPLPFLILASITEKIGSAIHFILFDIFNSIFALLLRVSIPIAIIAFIVFLWCGILLLPRNSFYNKSYPKE